MSRWGSDFNRRRWQADNFILAYYAGREAEPKGLPFVGEPEIESEPEKFSSKVNKIAHNLTQKGKYITNINEVRDVKDFHIGDRITHNTTSNKA